MSTEDHADATAPADPDTPADADLDEHNAAAVEAAIAGAHAQLVDAIAAARLVDAIAAAMLEAGEVTKSSTNVDQGYKFASAEAILAAVRRPLLERGVILTPQPRSYETEPITSRNGAKGEKITVAIDFTFRGYGATLAVTDWRGIGQDYGDKALGKAYTNAVKTFVRVEWLLPTEHDDPEASPSGERVDTAAAAAPPPWALPARDGTVAQVEVALASYIGEETATELVTAIAGAAGGALPAVAARALLGFVKRLDDAGGIGTDPPTEAPPETPTEAPPEAPTDPPTDVVAERELERLAKRDADADPVTEAIEGARRALAGEAPAEEAPADLPPEVPPPGTVDPGPVESTDPAKVAAALRKAGCICANPLGPTKELNDGCPIKGHGIPF